jgi:hypothetical protein
MEELSFIEVVGRGIHLGKETKRAFIYFLTKEETHSHEIHSYNDAN